MATEFRGPSALGVEAHKLGIFAGDKLSATVANGKRPYTGSAASLETAPSVGGHYSLDRRVHASATDCPQETRQIHALKAPRVGESKRLEGRRYPSYERGHSLARSLGKWNTTPSASWHPLAGGDRTRLQVDYRLRTHDF